MNGDTIRRAKDRLLMPSGGAINPDKALATKIYQKALANGQGVGRFPLHFGIDPWAINSQVLMLQVGGQQIHTTYGEVIGILAAATADVLAEELDAQKTTATPEG